MNVHDDLLALEERIGKALKDCETWRATGFGEKYLEAYDLVEALQLQLRQRLRLPPEARPSTDLLALGTR